MIDCKNARIRKLQNLGKCINSLRGIRNRCSKGRSSVVILKGYLCEYGLFVFTYTYVIY